MQVIAWALLVSLLALTIGACGDDDETAESTSSSVADSPDRGDIIDKRADFQRQPEAQSFEGARTVVGGGPTRTVPCFLNAAVPFRSGNTVSGYASSSCALPVDNGLRVCVVVAGVKRGCLPGPAGYQRVIGPYNGFRAAQIPCTRGVYYAISADGDIRTSRSVDRWTVFSPIVQLC